MLLCYYFLELLLLFVLSYRLYLELNISNNLLPLSLFNSSILLYV